MSKWQGLEQEQKAEIAVELFAELLNEVDEHTMTFGELPEYWTKKDVKAMNRTLGLLTAFYGLSSVD